MKWLTAVFVLLLLGLAAAPEAFDAFEAWLAHRSASVQTIDYLSRDIDELSASRRILPRKRNPGSKDDGADDAVD